MKLFQATLGLTLALTPGLLRAQFSIDPQSGGVVFDRGLAISSVAEIARRPINTDLITSQMVEGSLDLLTIKPGDELQPGRAWTSIEAAEGTFTATGRNTYIRCTITAVDDRIMLLQASGHAMVYVNGEPRMGDPYSHGYVTLPVQLRKGENTFLFAHASRGGMKAQLLPAPASGVAILDNDLTLPSPRSEQSITESLGVPIVNASARTHRVVVEARAGSMQSTSQVIDLAPLSVLKASIVAGMPASSEPLPLKLVVKENNALLAEQSLTLTPRRPGEHYSITYQSRVDGSTQYIALVSPKPDDSSTKPPGLVLSLHGASVEATSQAGSYSPQPGLLIACPTNRRPFGFDWEDWGRIDALESMDEVIRRYQTDPKHQYLTGHSMGGHGTWNISVLYPNKFAAIAPSAGWLSFDTYTSRGGPAYAPEGPLGDTFRAARASSDTLTYFPNLRSKGIFILHGDKDDNVPVDQARQARAALEALSIPHSFHEEPGAGHWWDNDAPGAACLDWPEIWKTFASHTLPDAPVAPAVTPPIDERRFPLGAFKRVFDRGFVMVYATGGTAEENAWSIAKARYDAEQWWYRGNGRAVVLSDAQFLQNKTAGNVILYGHQDSNRAWNTLIAPDSPVAVARGKARIEGKDLTGNDLAVLAALPRADQPNAEVGIIAGTGLPGSRATDRLGYFGSGVGFPEITLLRASIWREGFAGVEAAGRVGALVWK